MNLSDKIEKLLTQVNKPATYMGGELYSIHKSQEETEVYWGFCFPDLYEIGMSYLGLQIIYHVLTSCSGVYCQRLFAPGTDISTATLDISGTPYRVFKQNSNFLFKNSQTSL